MHAEILLEIGRNDTHRTFTYEIPKNLEMTIKPGKTVTVGVRHRQQTGIVVSLSETPPEFETKPILGVKEGSALLEPWQFELAYWMSETYFSSLFQCLKLMLPPRVRNPNAAIPHQIAYERTISPLPTRLGKREFELIKKFDQKNEWTRNELSEFSSTTLNNLVKKGALHSKKISAAHSVASHAKDTQPHLTLAQTQAVETLEANPGKTFLLHGVTGSGKTEVYLQAAANTLAQGRQAIFLVPEIALTPQMIERFESRFSGQVEVLHSHRSEGERDKSWWRIKQGHASLVIGSRSAIFAPTPALGLIVLDEEHESSYQQENSPSYHAKAVAQFRANQSKATLILGSATPSIETRYDVEQGKILHLRLLERINSVDGLPTVHLVDMREELQKKNFSIFSELLLEKMKATLERGKQILLFLNRRGHASSVLCRVCGHALACPRCDLNLTHHRTKEFNDQMVCHHCDWRQNLPTHCPSCDSTSIKFIGLGTQKIESELQKWFPTARLVRADRDTMRQKGSFETLYRTLKNGNADILIGTQMIGKGLDLPNLDLVGVILADIGLHRPDFRAAEHTFQLLTQVAGRTGRSHEPGEVVIQTYNPEHAALQFTQQHDDEGFYAKELKNRKELHHAPFSEQIRLTVRHKEQKNCSKKAEALAAELKPLAGSHRIQVAPALLYKQNDWYHTQVFIEGKNPHTVLQQKLDRSPLSGDWKIEINPRN